MKNVLKILSKKKDCRIVVIDTKMIAKRELVSFKGGQHIKRFLEQIITSCALFAGMNDFYSKTSFSFRLANNLTIFCEVKNGLFSMEYKEALNDFSGELSTLLGENSVLSITTGDWNIGLHTGTVEMNYDDIRMVFAHFTVQSEQLPSSFIFAERECTRGILMQPFPSAEKEDVGKTDTELRYLSSSLSNSEWSKVPNLYNDIGQLIWEKSLS